MTANTVSTFYGAALEREDRALSAQAIKNEYWIAVDKTYSPQDKCFDLTATHQDHDQVEKFYELIEWRLHQIYSIKVIDGDDDNLLIIWSSVPTVNQRLQMETAIALTWKLVTMFD